ncbi:hypothetical protein FHX82_004029 [Amycolatopsis bartoniae]|uniref:Uncharacterized protein n=1 Tax=Amycolatopsis bartoniae TaxID=941986 RepID=A0A8H9M4V9_9PSEU|nr:hypothetical protein [Amycolatopsis bartoniae]MBB2936965.1 hypothetical protein [Amycolatopsis bartoniae]GHF51520.1 hypothetical protein GCM10017566_25850 [Amycolatopsis bartoniae]
MCCPSATLTVWTSAWLSGSAAPDDVLDALLVWGEAHEVVAADAESAVGLDLPLAGDFPASPVQLLAALRARGASDARLVLPVPGDVRGLGGGGALAEAALRAGEAMLLPSLGFGLVPLHIAEGLVRWSVYKVDSPLGPEYVGLAEAEHGLTDAIRDSAGALQALDVAKDRPGVRAELSAWLRARPRPQWPAGTPGRALRVLQRAEEVGAILAVAEIDEPGGALSASAATLRADALRPLGNAVRLARYAAVNEAVRLFTDQADRPQ